MPILRKILACLLVMIAVANIAGAREMLHEGFEGASTAAHAEGDQPEGATPSGHLHHCHLGHCAFFLAESDAVFDVVFAVAAPESLPPMETAAREPVTSLIKPPCA